MRKKQPTQRVDQRRLNALVTGFLILTVLLCLYVTVQVISQGYVNLFGYSLFRVVTGSMEPTIRVGALMVSKQVEMETIQIGDIICFRAQEAAIFGRMMTHRVMDIATGADGGMLLATKGDANLALDGYFVTQANFVGKVIWYTGEGSILSTIFSVFTNKMGFLACIVFPCLLLATLVLQQSVKNIRSELEVAKRELQKELDKKEDPLLSMTQEERDEMYERIRAELIEELIHGAETPKE